MSEDICHICLESCNQNYLVTTCCKIKYHKTCYEESLKVNNTCPTCRTYFINFQEVEVKVPRCRFDFLLCIMFTSLFLVVASFTVLIASSILKVGTLGLTNNTMNGTVG
jgi:hypothetical protein